MFIVIFYQRFSDFRKSATARQVRALNHLMPRTYRPILQYRKDGCRIDPRRIQGYLRYYEKVVQFSHGMADAYTMMGFCYYQLGFIERAREAYEKAASLYPSYFWPTYNLGIMAFEEGKYEKAQDYFGRALAIDPQKSLTFALNSRHVLLPIVAAALKQKLDIAKSMRRAMVEVIYYEGLCLKARAETSQAFILILKAKSLMQQDESDPLELGHLGVQIF